MIGRLSSLSSSRVKARPRIGATPNTRKKSPDTYSASMRRGISFPSGVNFLVVPYATEATASNVLLSCRQSKKSGKETSSNTPALVPLVAVSACGYTMVSSETIRSGSGNGNARSKTPLTTLKIAVVAPIPSASVSTTITLNLRFVLNCRNAKVVSRYIQELPKNSFHPTESLTESSRPWHIIDDAQVQNCRANSRLAVPRWLMCLVGFYADLHIRHSVAHSC